MIKKSLLKIVSLLIIVGLNWTGLLAVGDTFAYFSDSAISQNKSFQSGILEISLSSGSDFSPNLTPNQSAIRNINIINNDTLPFQYAIKVANIPDELCNFVTLRVELEGTEKYNGNLNNFNVSPVEISDSQDNWVFTATLNGDNSDLEGKSCQFNFVFEGWQTNMTNYGSGGFSDEEKIESTIKTGFWVPVLDAIGNQSGTEGQLLQFTIGAIDPNGDTLTYSALGLPDGATFSGQTFSWTPTSDQLGDHNVYFEVSDGKYSDSENITITIAEIPPPEIIGVEAKNITTTSADIIWQTNETATSKVEYGTTTDYGSVLEDSNFVETHTISISGLATSTLYHFWVSSKNAAGKEAISGDYEFTTTNETN